MSFVSYAQNFEDVMLWRALKHIEQGFYIDVGAWSPDIDSVTCAFYERGWRGINIEPNPEFHQQLETSRPRDLNLKLAISDAEGIMTMNFLANPGLSTLDDSIAQRHQAAGWEASRQEVAVKTLAAIWQQHVPDGQPVHFLKVDVEGYEAAALRGNDWSRFRPWVVVVEATLPMSQLESHADWQPVLQEAGYQFAYADGLNRFYVAEEHADLMPAFEYPPNVFDEFILAAHQQSETRAQQAEHAAQQSEARAQQAEHAAQQSETRAQQTEHAAQQSEVRAQQAENAAHQSEARAQQAENAAQQSEARAQQAENAAQQSEARAQQAEHAAHQSEAMLKSVISSSSWRITGPLRLLVNGLRILRHGTTTQAFKAALRPLLGRVISFVSVRPRLKRTLLAWVSKHPRLEQKLRRFAAARKLAGIGIGQIDMRLEQAQSPPIELAHLTPRARQIYADLKAAIEKNNQETA